MKKIDFLREAMHRHNVHACIIPNTDPHGSEYIAEHWQALKYFSGFTGSAGTLVVTLRDTALWTDSRYHLQAEIELQNAGITLFKEGLEGVPGYLQWISSKLNEGETVAFHDTLFPAHKLFFHKNYFWNQGIEFNSTIDMINEAWTNRPPLPKSPIFIHPEKYAGQSATDKIKAVRRTLTEKHIDCLLINALDEIVWMLNIRACDVEYNLTCIAYLAIDTEKTILFIDKEKVSSAVYDYFIQHKIMLKNYTDFEIYLQNIDKQTIWIDEAKMNASIYRHLNADNIKARTTSPIQHLKSLNNDTQIAGIRLAAQKDGVALVRFLMWLEKSLNENKSPLNPLKGTSLTQTDSHPELAPFRGLGVESPLTELSIADQLHEFRKEQELFFGDSFATIAGYAEHGAIVHYHTTENTNASLLPDNLLLLDSGAHYWHGTTDITRTIAVGTPTDRQKRDFTLVLKGHIALAQAVFPVGTCGYQLDVLARKALWDDGLNYGHGTGHGIGYFSCVHEGNHNIRPKGNAVPFEAGMLLSNEPGVYREEEYGIRTENMVLVKNAGKDGFLCFETVSLCPIDKQLIDFSILNDNEKKWLKDYHQRIVKELNKFLTEEEKEWLKKQAP